jgi:hypothetical protein
MVYFTQRTMHDNGLVVFDGIHVVKKRLWWQHYFEGKFWTEESMSASVLAFGVISQPCPAVMAVDGHIWVRPAFDPGICWFKLASWPLACVQNVQNWPQDGFPLERSIPGLHWYTVKPQYWDCIGIQSNLNTGIAWLNTVEPYITGTETESLTWVAKYFCLVR